MALIHWCIEVEQFLQSGATRDQAQEYIEEEIELLTDQYYEGMSAEEAAEFAFKRRTKTRIN